MSTRLVSVVSVDRSTGVATTEQWSEAALIAGLMSPVLAALIATVAPLFLLVTTDGLAVRVRFNPEKEI